MAMKRVSPALSPDAYVAALSGWRRDRVEMLRAAALAAQPDVEVIKWGNIVCMANGGPVLLIRAEDTRVLYGFWRGKRLRHIEPRLKASGKYELATMVIHEDTSLDPALARELARAAVALNHDIGNPTARS